MRAPPKIATPAFWLKSIVALVASFGAFLGYLGFFGGAVFIEIPPTAQPTADRSGLVAVFLSGDMGLDVGMGSPIAKRLAADGIPVIAVNSLTYFRKQRSLLDVEALVTAATRRALSFGHARQVILIGQSLGADVLQAGLAGLPQELRGKVRVVALIGPTDTIYFRVSPLEMLDWAAPDADAMQTARQISWVPVLCIYGAEESDSLCPSLRLANVHSVKLPGGHLLRWNIDGVHSAIIRAIDASAIAKLGVTSISLAVNIPASSQSARYGAIIAI